ncbi:MAG TPA: SPFH/Band 7/PHB domain protein, partial [Micromonospora sp.]
EAAEAARAAASAAEQVNHEVRAAEAQLTSGPPSLPAPEPVDPASLLDDPADQERTRRL